MQNLWSWMTVWGLLLSVHGAAMAAEADWASAEKVAEVEAGERTEADASWWGFDEEDSTSYLQAAIDSGVEKLVIPKMDSPWIVEPVELTQDNQTLVFEQGTVVNAKEGSFRGGGDCLFEARNRQNLALIGYGAVFEMRKEDYWEAPYEEAEWRHALAIRGSSNVTVAGLTLRRSGGDGIYLGVTGANNVNEDVVIREVVCDENHRQGMSVISARNLLVENSMFNRTVGTAPQAGIDLEPNNADEELTNVLIRNCMFEDNERLGMHMWLGNMDEHSEPVSVVWENNYVRGGDIGIHCGNARGVQGTIKYRGNIVEDTAYAGIFLREKGYDTAELTVEDLVLHDVATKDPEDYGWPSAPIVLHGSRAEQFPRQGGIELKRIVVRQTRELDRPVFQTTARQGFEEWRDVTGSIFVNVPGEFDTDVVNAGEDFDVRINPVADVLPQ